ncbi:MAG: hypothetical protein R2747_22570 [Pyrinomonadaceae bacterium]
MSYKIAPPRNITIDVTGKVVYQAGPWGSHRPVRNWGDAVLWAYDQTGRNKYLLGQDVFDGEGRFKLTADAAHIPANLPKDPVIQQQLVEFRLELAETYTKEEEILILDNLQWTQGRLHDLGQIRVKWKPAIPILATVNLSEFSDSQILARHLLMLIETMPENPTRGGTPYKITLLAEPADNNPDIPIRKLFEQLEPGKLPPDLVRRVCFEANKIPILHSTAGSPSEQIKHFLRQISGLNIKKAERTSTLDSLITGFGNALNKRLVDPVWEEAPDMAAVCVLLFMIAVMAKNGRVRFHIKTGTYNFPRMTMRNYQKTEVLISF